eukprot:3800822-Rhodomonas_salina.2
MGIWSEGLHESLQRAPKGPNFGTYELSLRPVEMACEMEGVFSTTEDIPGAESHKLKECVAPCFVGKNYCKTCLEQILILRTLQCGIARLASMPKQVSPSRMLLGSREIGDGVQS